MYRKLLKIINTNHKYLKMFMIFNQHNNNNLMKKKTSKRAE